MQVLEHGVGNVDHEGVGPVRRHGGFGDPDLSVGVRYLDLDRETWPKAGPAPHPWRRGPARLALRERLETRGPKVGVEGDRPFDPLPAHEDETRPVYERDR